MVKELTKEEIKELQSKANLAKAELKYGQITIEEAKEIASPYIKVVNDISKKVAKKYGMKARLVNVNSFLR